MLETTVKSIADFYSLFIIIIVLNIFFKNLKILNIVFLFFTILISNVYFQNYILKKYSLFYKPNTTISSSKDYDVIILGGNYLKRTENFFNLLKKTKINKVLYIYDKYNLRENVFLKQINQNLEIIYEKSSSTIEDLRIINNNLDNLDNDLVIITDDFHLPRLNKYLIKFDKNVSFFPIKNYEDFDKNKIINLNRGAYFFNAILRESLAIVYYNIKGY